MFCWRESYVTPLLSAKNGRWFPRTEKKEHALATTRFKWFESCTVVTARLCPVASTSAWGFFVVCPPPQTHPPECPKRGLSANMQAMVRGPPWACMQTLGGGNNTCTHQTYTIFCHRIAVAPERHARVSRATKQTPHANNPPKHFGLHGLPRCLHKNHCWGNLTSGIVSFAQISTLVGNHPLASDGRI